MFAKTHSHRVGTAGLLLAAAVAFALPNLSARAGEDALFTELSGMAPGLAQPVLRQAVQAVNCALAQGAAPAERLAIIDFSKPSSEHRLWIFDLAARELVLAEWVAHGRNSGDLYANAFSNVSGSHQSSLGLFRAQESYFGRHGYSLRLDGLEPGINDAARARAIVIHAADYVSPDWIARQGRIGRSHGCPAVRPEVVETVVDSLKGGQFVFKFFPDDQWLSASGYLNCGVERVAQISPER